MTQIKLKSVVEFLFWILLFVLALAYFNKIWDLYLYFLIGALLFILLIIETILSFKHRRKAKSKKKVEKKIKKEYVKQDKVIKPDKKIFHKELSALFSFIAILIVVFSMIIQKNKFIEFLSFKYTHSYFILALIVIAFVIMILMFVEYIQAKKTEKLKKFEHKIKINYDIFFLFGLVVVIIAYILSNWITAVLGLILMVVSLVAHHLANKKNKIKEKITKPEKTIPDKAPEKLQLLLEKPAANILTKIKQEEKKAKEEEYSEKLKLKELQRTIKEEEKQRKREEKLIQKSEKLAKADEKIKQKAIDKEKKRLEKINKSKEKILMKEKALGKTQKNRKEIERIIKMKSSLNLKSRYETDFDRMLLLIEKYERLKFSDAAKIFGISMDKVEEWAAILEQHKILKIHYPAIGEPELRIEK